MSGAHDFDPFDLAGQAETTAEQAELLKARRIIEASDFKWLLAHKQGRRLLYRLLSMTGVYQLSYRGDVNMTHFNEGRRSIGLVLLSDTMELAPERFNDMMKEQRDGD